MLADDGPRAADRAERRETQLARALLPLALPQPLEHELEIRRLDAGVGRRLVEHRLDERVLRRERLPAELAVAGERAEDRGAPGLAVEPVEPQQVREQLGNPAGELVELGQRVVAQREQDVDAQAGPAQELRQRRAQRPFEAVVEDVLLEVVEQQVQLAAAAGPRRRPCRRGRPSRRGRRTPRAPTRSGEPAGSSAHASCTTTGAPLSSRSRRATPAPRSELLPTPLGP